MRQVVFDLHGMRLHLGAAAACGPDIAARIKQICRIMPEYMLESKGKHAARECLGIPCACNYARLIYKSFPCRWFTPHALGEVPEAKYLDVILYSREQLVKEHKAMPSKGDADALPQAPWGIISIKAQDEDHETPMQVWAPAKA